MTLDREAENSSIEVISCFQGKNYRSLRELTQETGLESALNVLILIKFLRFKELKLLRCI